MSASDSGFKLFPKIYRKKVALPNLSEKTLINLTEDHRNIGIDDIKHKTFINVDEAGTEAAASTVVEGYKGGPPSFSARSPFVYVIRDDRSGTTLFMGKVEDPVAE